MKIIKYFKSLFFKKKKEKYPEISTLRLKGNTPEVLTKFEWNPSGTKETWTNLFEYWKSVYCIYLPSEDRYYSLKELEKTPKCKLKQSL